MVAMLSPDPDDCGGGGGAAALDTDRLGDAVRGCLDDDEMEVDTLDLAGDLDADLMGGPLTDVALDA